MINPIYSSEKILSYVYIGIHKESYQFYIGYRCKNVKNKIPSHLDLGIKYFTSSRQVKELGFNNFNWVIFAEFFNPNDAYSFEQDLIFEKINNPLCLNKKCHKYSKWSTAGCSTNKGKKFSEEHKTKLSESHKGKTVSDSTKEKLRQSNLGKILSEDHKTKISENSYFKTEEGKQHMSKVRKGVKKSEEHKAKISQSLKGHKVSEETKQKMSEAKNKIIF